MLPAAAYEKVNKESEVDKTVCTNLEDDWSNPYCYWFISCLLCLQGALRRLMHTEVCIGLDIAHFPSLMYGFIMQQIWGWGNCMWLKPITGI